MLSFTGGTLDVSAARCTPGGYAGEPIHPKTKTQRTIPSQKTTTWRTHPSQKFPKQKHLMATVDFCQLSKVLRWQMICDVLSENSTSQEYGIFPPRAAGFIIRWQFFFLTDRILGLWQSFFTNCILHGLKPPFFIPTSFKNIQEITVQDELSGRNFRGSISTRSSQKPMDSWTPDLIRARQEASRAAYSTEMFDFDKLPYSRNET